MYEQDEIAAPMREFCAANGKYFGINCKYYRYKPQKKTPVATNKNKKTTGVA